MYNKLINKAIIFSWLLITAGAAHAELSFVTTGTVTLTQPFNGISGLTPPPKDIGSTLNVGHLDFTGPGSEMVTYTFLGAESVTFVDEFYDILSGTKLLESDPIGTSVSSVVNTVGPLSFKFGGNVDAGKFAINGEPSGWSPGTSIALIGTDVLINSVVYQYVIGYNDSAGSLLYGDWDDFVIGVNAAPIPEPEAYAMLLAGLSLMGFIARHRKQNV